MRAQDVRKAAELKGAKLGGRAQSGTHDEVHRRRRQERQIRETNRLLRCWGRRSPAAGGGSGRHIGTPAETV